MLRRRKFNFYSSKTFKKIQKKPYAVFDGVNDYINFGNKSTFNITGGNISIAAWLHPTGYRNQSTIATKAGLYYLEMISDGRLQVYLYGTTPSGYRISTATVPLNVWTHVVFTYDGANIRFYINGVLTDTIPTTGAIAGNLGHPLACGTNTADMKRIFEGGIADLQLWNKTLTPDEVQKSMLHSYSAPQPNLMGNWKLNGNSKDSSGYVNDGTDMNGLTYDTKYPDYRRLSYANFDGVNDYVRRDNLNFSSNTITVDFWARIDRLDGRNYAFDTRYNRLPLMKWGDGNSAIITWGLSGGWINHTQGNKVGKWTHYALVANGTTEFLYIDGVQVATQTQRAAISFTQLTIGDYYGGGYSMMGCIDEFKVWDKALTVEEVKASMYNSYNTPQDNLVAYYKLNSTARDSSGNNYHGVEYNGVTYTINRENYANLDGVNDYIQATTQPMQYLPLNGYITLAVSFRYTSNKQYQAIAGQKYLGGYVNGYGIFTWYGEVTAQVRLYSAGVRTVRSGILVNDGKWHRAVMIANFVTKSLLFYVDGQYIGTDTLLHNPDDGMRDLSSFRIGVNDSNSFYYNGSLDDVQLSNELWTEADIVADYEAFGEKMIGNPLLHYKLDGNADDSSVNKNHGTSYNGTQFI